MSFLYLICRREIPGGWKLLYKLRPALNALHYEILVRTKLRAISITLMTQSFLQILHKIKVYIPIRFQKEI